MRKLRLIPLSIYIISIAYLGESLIAKDPLTTIARLITDGVKPESENKTIESDDDCYEGLGCFPNVEPWISILRPLPKPNSPSDINVKLYFYSRSSPDRYNVTLWPEISLQGSNFQASRNKTVFITHGFASSGTSQWLINMKDAYLEEMDANIFLVDWEKGASDLNYLQVASNTRIVGAELTRFGKYLLDQGVDISTLHLIGHSLGSHISAYMAKGLKTSNENGTMKVGRITGLDPAQPAFENNSPQVRLDRGDADFIDVLHTDARPFLPFLGFGIMQPVGHVDIYVNGGSGQPGCKDIKINNITSLADLAKIPVEIISRWVSCSHGRSYEVFTSAIALRDNCTIWGRKIDKTEKLINLLSGGALALAEPIFKDIELEDCTTENCTIVGLLTPLLKARGYFLATTSSETPYCDFDTEDVIKLKNFLRGAVSQITPVLEKGKKLFEIPGLLLSKI